MGAKRLGVELAARRANEVELGMAGDVMSRDDGVLGLEHDVAAGIDEE